MMFNRTVNALIGVVALVVATSFVSATPYSRNVAKSIDRSESQASQIETIYATLVKEKVLQKISDRKPALLKASFTSVKSKRVLKGANRNKAYAKNLRVTATAYTSHANQTDSTPNIAAWGDRLKPGMKSIAVSRDLLNVYGLKHGQKVRIKGLKGEYRVLDKMNKRWKKKIDIYMGMDKRRAFRWGRRKVHIYWN